jgi:hypothetical protein
MIRLVFRYRTLTRVLQSIAVASLSANLARVAKLADARDLKSRVPKGTYRFNSGPGHHAFQLTTDVTDVDASNLLH